MTEIELSIIGIEMVIERPGGDERTKECSAHVENNLYNDRSLRYTTSKRKGDELEPEAKIQKE